MPTATRPSQVAPRTVWTVGLHALALAGLVLVLHRAWSVVELVLLAVLGVLALEPLVARVQRLRRGAGLPRGVAVALVDTGVLGLGALLAWRLLPLAIQQVRHLAEELPALLEALQRRGTLTWVEDRLGTPGELHAELGRLSHALVAPAEKATHMLILGVTAALTVVTLIVFMQLFGRSVLNALLGWLTPGRRAHALGLAERMAGAVGGFVCGTLVTAVVRGAVVGALLFFVGVPYFVPLAVVAAVLGIVPLLGSALSTVLIGATALASGGPHTALVAAGGFLLFEQVDAHVLDPIVQRRTLRMNPLLITLVVLLGTVLEGLLGALLALPVASAVQVLISEVRQQREERQQPQERAPEPAPPPVGVRPEVPSVLPPGGLPESVH